MDKKIEIYSDSLDDTSLEHFLNKWTAIQQAIPEQYRRLAQVSWCLSEYHGFGIITYSRPETADEQAAREMHDKYYEEERKRRDLATLARLKQKYESEA